MLSESTSPTEYNVFACRAAMPSLISISSHYYAYIEGFPIDCSAIQCSNYHSSNNIKQQGGVAQICLPAGQLDFDARTGEL